MTGKHMSYMLAAAGALGISAVAATRLPQQEAAEAPIATVAPAAPAATPINGGLDAGTFRRIAEEQMPAVVSIRTLATAQAPTTGFFGDERLRQFFGMPNAPAERVLEGAGSGFIIDRSGLILTNHHVVENAERIEVALFPNPEDDPDDVRRYQARVLGRDPLTDSALLRLEGAPNLPTARLGDSDAMRPGDWVVAIGNPFALSHTVTVGVISATSRPFPVEGRLQRVLQTDAAVNPGNSGGPLLNLRGEVVGVNTAIFSSGAGGGNLGIGFSVPINLIRGLVPRLQQGDVKRGRIGVEIASIPGEARAQLGVGQSGGVLVASVEAGGPAERAGIRPGDVILEFQGERIDDADELVRLVSDAAPGTNARIVVMSNKLRRELPITLGELTTAAARQQQQPQSGTETTEGLGLTLAALDPAVAQRLGLAAGDGGALVTRVARGSTAAEGGVQPGDVILEVNREAVRGLQATAERLRNLTTSTTNFLLVQREGRRLFLVLPAGK